MKQNKFQRLVIESFILYDNKTWKKLRTVVDPKELTDRLGGNGAYDMEQIQADSLSHEFVAEFLAKNSKHDDGFVGSYLCAFYYEYSSVNSELIYG